MGMSIGSAALTLAADSSPLEKDLKKSQGLISRFASGTKSLFKSALSGAAFGGPAAIAAVGVNKAISSFSNWRDRIQQTKDAADSLGESVGGISGLSYVFDKDIPATEDAVRNLQKKISESFQGKGEAVNLFDRLGVSAKELEAMPLEEKFAAISDAISKLDASAATEIGDKLFGGASKKILKELNQGVGEFKSKLAEGKDLGYGDQVSKSAENVDRLGKTLDRLGDRAESMFADLLPAVEPLLDGLASYWETFIAPMARWGGEFIGGIATVGKELWTVFKPLVGPIFGKDAGKGLAKWLGSGRDAALWMAKYLGMGIGYAYDVIKRGGGLFLKYITEPAVRFFKFFTDGFADLIGLARSTALGRTLFSAEDERNARSFTERVGRAAESVNRTAATMLDSQIGNSAKKWESQIDKIRLKIKAIDRIELGGGIVNPATKERLKLEELNLQAFELSTEILNATKALGGMTEYESKIVALESAFNALGKESEYNWGWFRKIAEQLESVKRGMDLIKGESPLQAMVRDAQGLQDALTKQKITEEQFFLGNAKLAERFQQLANSRQDASVILKDSREAANLVLQARFGGRSQQSDIQQQMLNYIRQQTEIERQQLIVGKQLAEAIKNNKLPSTK